MAPVRCWGHCTIRTSSYACAGPVNRCVEMLKIDTRDLGRRVKYVLSMELAAAGRSEREASATPSRTTCLGTLGTTTARVKKEDLREDMRIDTQSSAVPHWH